MDTRGWNLWILVAAAAVIALPLSVGLNLAVAALLGLPLESLVGYTGILSAVVFMVVLHLLPRVWPRDR